MTLLNQEAYQLLLNANPILEVADVENWYSLTYPFFKDAPLNSMDDFWKIVAFTYSWMPTIPEVKPKLIKDPDALLTQLQALKRGEEAHLSELLKQLIPVINNSLIGVSKVLHFIAPDQVPIIDRNVLNGWDIFFFRLHRDFMVPKLPSYTTALNQRHILKYLHYRDMLLQWVANSAGTVTLRDLELGFFHLGRNVSVEPRLYIFQS